MNAYLSEHAPTTVRADNIATLATPLLTWWCAKFPFLSQIKATTCKAYVAWRTAQPRKGRRSGTVSESTARHELGLLSTAIQYYHAEYGPLSALPVVTLPASSPPKEDYWLRRKEVAERIRAARRLPKCKHMIRVLLIGVYSGSRPGTTNRLWWIPSTAGGWIDLDTETIHRRPIGATQSNKRQPKARIHRRLLPWLRRWYKADMVDGVKRRDRDGKRRVKRTVQCPHVIHYGGKPIKKLRRSWASVAIAAGHAQRVGTDAAGKPIWRIPDGPHICRHTFATWLMQGAVDMTQAAGYLGMSEKMLEEVYGHHHPDFQKAAASADGRRRVRP